MQRAAFVVALGLGLATVAGTDRAYAFDSETLIARVPFAFNVEKTLLPPGEYLLRRTSGLDTHVLQLTTRDGRRGVFFLTVDTSPRHSIERAELVFYRYGEQSFLRQVRVPNLKSALLPASSREREVARRLASVSPVPVRVAASVQ
jgi:hypothetical protein